MPSLSNKKKKKTERTSEGQSKKMKLRLKRLEKITSRIVPLPDSLLSDRVKKVTDKTQECSNYDEMIEAWKSSMRWTIELEQILISMLAVVVSTEQKGDQIFLMVIAPPSSGKTRLCDALLTSQHCHALEHLTGFHSGWKGDDGEDYSLIARIDRKTLITPEGDVLMSSPNFAQVMSQQRRIFDGTSGASYKNQKEDKRYTGLRTPWIIAGTPTLMDSDQTRLGDRFLKITMTSPDIDEKRKIQSRVFQSALASVMETSSKEEKELNEGSMRASYELTGGYVNYLRENAEALLKRVGSTDLDKLEKACVTYGEFAADFRARPSTGEDSEVEDSQEMPHRLTSQFLRFIFCAAAVRGEEEISDSTYDILRKTVIDTSGGRTLQIGEALYNEPKGLTIKSLYSKINVSEAKVRRLMRFLIDIKVVRKIQKKRRTKSGSLSRTTTIFYKLTDRVRGLMDFVYRTNT